MEDAGAGKRPASRSYLGLSPAALVPTLFQAAHKRTALLSGFAAAGLGSGLAAGAAHCGEVHPAAHDDEAQHSYKDVLETDAHQQQEDAGQRAQDPNDHMPG